VLAELEVLAGVLEVLAAAGVALVAAAGVVALVAAAGVTLVLLAVAALETTVVVLLVPMFELGEAVVGALAATTSAGVPERLALLASLAVLAVLLSEPPPQAVRAALMLSSPMHFN
jgi:hypothetical protein